MGHQGKPLQVHGDGTQSRDFTYIDNVVSANLLAARGAGGGRLGQVLQRRLRQPHEPARHHRALERMLGRPFERKHSPTRVGDVPHTLADVSAAKRDMGYKPLVEFDEGLRRTVEFFTEEKPR